VWLLAANCVIANASCYSRDPHSGKNADEKCLEVAAAEANAELCSSKTSCSICVGTILSNGFSTCQWFNKSKSCGTACTLDTGCGDSYCGYICGDSTCDANEEPPTPNNNNNNSSSASAAARLVVSILTSGILSTLITATLA
jgi:hypothetical protein